MKSRTSQKLIVLLLLYVSLCVSVLSAETDKAIATDGSTHSSTITIAYYYHGMYMSKARINAYAGYDVEYLYEVAKYTGWNYKFVDYPDFKSALEAAERGEVDLLPEILYTEERAEKLLYSIEDMGRQYVTILVKADDTTHAIGNLHSLVGQRIGALEGWLDTDYFKRLDKDNNLNTELVIVKEIHDVFALLDSNQVDAVVVSEIGPSEKYQVLYKFDPMYVYLTMPKKNASLMNELNLAMNQISMNNPEFKASLNRKYFTKSKFQKPQFTSAEQAYIDRRKPIIVEMGENNPPFSYTDKNGMLIGAVPDMFSRISDLCGLQFVCRGVAEPRIAEMDLHQGKIQAIAKITENQPVMISRGMRLTDHYMDLPLNEISRTGTTKVERIAVPEEVATVYRESPGGAESLANLDVHYLTTVHGCFEALRNDEVDAVICDDISASYLLNHSRVSEFVVTALNGYSYPVSVGVSIDEDFELYSIINKCIQYINHFSINDLVQKYTLAVNAAPFSFLNKVPTSVIFMYTAILIFAILGLFILLVLLRKHAHKERLLVAEQEKIKQEAKASAERTEFFGNISHDMRTPLNGILGFTDMALEKSTNEEVKECLNKIKISGKLLLDLVNDTLIIAKTENKKFVLHPEIISSKEIIDDIVVPIKAAAEAKGIALSVDVSKMYNGYIKVDRLNVQKVFLNLLTNAVKFTPSGGQIDFIVDNSKTYDKGVMCKATVRDDGIGMSTSFIPHMFEPFTQESPRKSNNTGTGLGLSIVKHLVEVMNGTIDVKSKQGYGTEFTVVLPIETAPDYHPVQKEKAFLDFAGKTVLLCEDNEMNREIAKVLLEKQNLHVDCAEDGSEGVLMFNDSKIGTYMAVFMDIRMPKMNGYDAAKAIRALKVKRADAATVPIIALSADAYDEDKRKAKEAGMNAHVSKPIDPEELLGVLRDIIEGAC